MRQRELRRLQAQLVELTLHQRSGVGAAELSVQRWVLARHQSPSACPHCQSRHLVRNGQAHGFQHFRCRGCGVTLTA
ncbi:transposase-like zinc-binding domain-containing protein [Luteimonas fraxinea]|uniref:transposase-like zinc-binding domain-containing protein n=1 Tax=Luteimonas fraxinea TaxID=2901869 RepID=UPI003CCDA65F